MDFSLVESDEDVLWREGMVEVGARGLLRSGWVEGGVAVGRANVLTWGATVSRRLSWHWHAGACHCLAFHPTP